MQPDPVMPFTPPSRRGLAAIAVLLAWGGSLGWLAARQLGRTESATLTSAAALSLSPGDAWFRITAAGAQVGAVGVTLDTLSPGYRILENLFLDLPGPGGAARATRISEVVLAPTLALERLGSRYAGGGRREETTVARRNGRLALTLARGETVVQTDSGFGDGPVPLLVIPYRLALTGALGTAEGRTLPILSGWPPVAQEGRSRPEAEAGTAVFADSSVLDPGRQWRAVREDTVATRAVVVETPNGVVRLTVDGRGTLVALEHALGVRWERTDFALAVQAYREAVDSGTARPDGAWPRAGVLATAGTADPSDTTPRRYLITRRDGSPLPGWAARALVGDRQRVIADSVLAVGVAQGSFGRAPDLLPADPLIQTGDPAVVALAGELAASVADRDWAAVARALRRRVALDTAAIAAQDAAGTLAAGRARPDGIARLFVAVLQAGGVRARYVVGVAPRDAMLLTHAWAEVYNPGRRAWDAADPVRGTARASTDLIRIGMGGSSHPDDLLPLVADIAFRPIPTPVREEAP